MRIPFPSARSVFAIASIFLAISAAACGSTVDNGAGGAGVDTGGHLFACGNKMCDSATEYCMHHAVQGDPGCAQLDHHTCEPYPATCGLEATCACLPPAGGCDIEPGCSMSDGGEIFACEQQVC